MADEQQNQEKKVEAPVAESTKVSADDLSNDAVATLHNILYSGITMSVKIAEHIADLQKWTKRLIEERNIPREK